MPLMVLFSILAKLLTSRIPPPLLAVELPLMVLLATLREVAVPLIPPPPGEEKLPLMVQSVIVTVAPPLKIFG